jgi:hypothetical protein
MENKVTKDQLGMKLKKCPCCQGFVHNAYFGAETCQKCADEEDGLNNNDDDDDDDNDANDDGVSINIFQ